MPPKRPSMVSFDDKRRGETDLYGPDATVIRLDMVDRSYRHDADVDEEKSMHAGTLV